MDINEMRKILDNRSLVDLSELVTIMDKEHAHDLAQTAEHYALWLLRAARYIDGRVYDMQDHNYAVYEQNRILTKVRKALGYSYPKQDIHF